MMWVFGAQTRRIALAVCVAATALGCASTDSARYVQFRTAQATLNDRATEALKLELIDVATAKRILALSEAISEQCAAYREAVDAGTSPRSARAILQTIARLVRRAELLLPAEEIMP